MCASVSFAHEALLRVCVYIYTHTHEKKVSLNLDQVPILNFYLTPATSTFIFKIL